MIKELQSIKERRLLQLGDVLFFFNKNNLLSKNIAYLSKHKYSHEKKLPNISHVAIYLGNGKQEIFEAVPPKSRIISLSHYYQKKYDIFVKRINGLTVEQIEQIKSNIYSLYKEHHHYDYSSFIGYFINLVFKLKTNNNIFGIEHAEVCSQAVRKCIEPPINLYLKDTIENTTPLDLYMSPALNLVWSNKI